MNLTDEEKLRLKILKIKLRKGLHRGVKTGIKITKKVGLVLGLTLVSLCGKAQTQTSFKDILASAIIEQKDSGELLGMLENRGRKDTKLPWWGFYTYRIG